jgi:hypothetical protein
MLSSAHLTKPLFRVPSELFGAIVDEVNTLVADIQQGHQIIVQQRIQSYQVPNWVEGCGRSMDDGKPLFDEHEFNTVPKVIEGGAIDQWLKSLGFATYRTRIMIVQPRSCYSIHKDLSPRIHLPITTTRNALMCFPYHQRMFHIPKQWTYWVDTRKHHTFINTDTVSRIHIVACTDHIIEELGNQTIPTSV